MPRLDTVYDILATILVYSVAGAGIAGIYIGCISSNDALLAGGVVTLIIAALLLMEGYRKEPR